MRGGQQRPALTGGGGCAILALRNSADGEIGRGVSTIPNLILAFALTLAAGLSTGIGGAIAMVVGHTNRRFLSVSLGFSAGVMVYVSMVELLDTAREYLSQALGGKAGGWAAAAAFFGGILLIGVIDRIIPSEENPHEPKPVEIQHEPPRERLTRLGMITALAIGVHNFPEGMATFVSALQQPNVAIPIVAAIAIHNIPEGIAVAVPLYQATGSKGKALGWSFLSGLAEPIGALVGWLLLMPFLNGVVFGVVFGAIAGIMVFISFDELLPAARAYGEHHRSIYGLVAGMAVMAVSLLLFE